MYKTSEAKRTYQKQYREDNKEYYQTWRDNHKNEKKAWSKNYNKSPEGKKCGIISNWKTRGLICEDYNALYNQYINVANCDNCCITFGTKGDGTGSHKCMDHNHETGAFRNFLCCACNNRMG